MRQTTLVTALAVLLGIYLQLAIGDIFGAKINFSLATLVVASFFSTFLELFILILFSVFILNWQPAFSPEIIVFSILPIIVFFIYKFIPIKQWLVAIIMVASSLLAFYLVISANFFISSPVVFAEDMLGSIIFGTLIFYILQKSNSRA